ncbi:MAG TPA: gamma-glutamyltransferase [Bacteroidota bacterium]|nr:gamma-glutamyltransferase [Bacteroidota bacterium]
MKFRPLSAGILAAAVLLLAACDIRNVPAGAGTGMVITADSMASAVGLAVLDRGGNAVDAAVAAGFALAVVYPGAGNIGGGGFMVLRMPDGSSHSVDFREMAPRRSTADMYAGNPDASVDGCLAAAVPGTVAGLLAALEKYGTMDRAELLRPSIELAGMGFRVNANLAGALAGYREELDRFPSTKRIFFRDGVPLVEGDLLLQPDLGRTIRRIADSGTAGFYSGRTAALITAHMNSSGGYIGDADLEAYRAVFRPVLKGSYRGYEIDAMGPPSSGGICLLQALALLEPYDLRSLGFHTAPPVHLIAEAMKRSFSMRAAYLGDPDFVDVPVGDLLRDGRLAAHELAIDTARAVPAELLAGFPGTPREGTQTTHYSVIDRRGMAVAVTYTINDIFGNKDVVEGAGFFLNDEMDDFVTVPGQANMYGLVGGRENMIAPGKRPLSSMSPTIVSKDGRPVLIIGARGGSMIITSVLQAVINIVDYGLPPLEAVRAPRFHHQWKPDTLWFETGAFGPEVRAELVRRGHSLREIAWKIGGIEAIYIDPETGTFHGVPDYREGGVAAGR